MTGRILRRLATLVVALLLAYAALLVGIFVVMRQPPDRFGRIMARMPTAVFMIVPFEPMWTVARAGNLEVGDNAPDFVLRTADRKRHEQQPETHVQLSSFRGRQPVVLVFGSYT
jgi:hypothetical protein